MSPLGARKASIPKSKGKRSRKRKRKASKAEPAPTNDDPEDPVNRPHGDAENKSAEERREEVKLADSAPLVASHVLVGFNSINRRLEQLSTYSREPLRVASGEAPQTDSKPKHLAAVFLLRPLNDLIYSHLPATCHTASLAHPERPATRLVLLDPSSEKRVAEALCNAHVSVLAMTEADGADTECAVTALLEYVWEHVERADGGWLQEAVEGKWVGTKIDVQ